MSDFQTLLAEHQALQKLLAEQPGAVELERVRKLITEAREAGAIVGEPPQREQLRAILRVWGTYLYEHTGEYPSTVLRPFEGMLPMPGLPASRLWPWVMVATVALIIVVAAVIALLIQRGTTPQPTATPEITEPPLINTPFATPTPRPTLPPVTIEATPLPTTPPPTTPPGLVLQVNSPEAGYVNVRSSPDVNAAVIITAAHTSEVSALDPEADVRAKVGQAGQWLHIRTPNGTEGFVAADYLTLPGSAQPTQPPASGGLKLQVNSPEVGYLNVRDTPNISGNVVVQARNGDLLTALDPEADVRAKVGQTDQWLKVRTADGKEGYAAAVYLQIAP